MSKEQIEVGDVVKLKSNSTLLTVEQVQHYPCDTYVSVAWFDEGHSVLHRGKLDINLVDFVR